MSYLSNDNNSMSFNNFNNLPTLPYKIFERLATLTSDDSENLWKAIAYDTIDCISQTALTYEQKIALIWNANQSDELSYRIFNKPLIVSAMNTSAEMTQLRMYRYGIIPTNRQQAVILFETDIYTADKTACIYDENGINVERTDYIEAKLLSCLNGADLNVGVDYFRFDAELNSSIKSLMNINNSKAFYGRSLLMGMIYADISTGEVAVMVDIEALKATDFINCNPVEYSLSDGNVISINPLTVEDYAIYESAVQLFTIIKDDIPQVEIIQMSYLEFLLKEVLAKNDNLLSEFIKVCDKCFGYQYISSDVSETGKTRLLLCVKKNKSKKVIVDKIITSKDFDEIKKIVLFQNDANYSDRELSADVREVVEDYYKIKQQNVSTPSLERKIAYIIGKTGMSLQEIKSMYIRYFDLVYESLLDGDNFIADKIIQASFKYEVKDEIIHPQNRKPIDFVSAAFQDKEAFEQKVNSVSQV